MSKYSFEIFLEEQTETPRGLSVAPDGSLWVANSNDVIHYDVSGKVISTIGNAEREIGSHNIPIPNTGEFTLARGIVAAKDGTVWVADGVNYFRGGMGESYSRIQQFNDKGNKTLSAIELPTPYAPFEGDGFDIALAKNGSLWVADAYKGKIGHYGSDGSFIQEIGEFGKVSGIDATSDGSIWIAEGYNNRLLHINPDGSLITIVGEVGVDAGQFNWPHGLAIAPDGSFWVADTGNHRIQHFSSKGDYIEELGGLGPEIGLFNQPFDIEVGADGVLWVADTTNKRVQKISPVHTTQGKLAVEYDDKNERVILHDVLVADLHYQAVLKFQNGYFVLESASMTNIYYDSPAVFDETASLLSVPLAWAFNTEYQASFKHLDNFVFELVSATKNEIEEF